MIDFFGLLVGGAAALIATIGAEFLARWWLRHQNLYRVWLPGSRHELRPDPAISPELESIVRFEVNCEGERGSEVPDEGEGLYRILVAGGSAVEGYLLDQPSNVAGALQRLLQTPQSLETLGASRVHVGNISRAGIGSEALACLLERVLPLYRRLDVIVIMVGGSDLNQWIERGAPNHIEPYEFVVSDVFDCHPEGPFGWTPRRLALYELSKRLWWGRLRRVRRIHPAARWIQRAREMRAAAKEIRTEMPNPAALLDYFEINLRGCLVTAKRHASRVLLLRQPWFGKKHCPEELANLWCGAIGRPWQDTVSAYYSIDVVAQLMAAMDKRAAQVAQECNVEHVDLMPVLERNLKTYYDFFHFTPAGAAKVAETAATAILQQRLHGELSGRRAYTASGSAYHQRFPDQYVQAHRDSH